MDTQLVQDAVAVAVQQAHRMDLAQREGTATIVEMNASGPGIHDILIDGDSIATPVPAHQITGIALRNGSRVAVLFVAPHQCWIIGELTRTSAAFRVWASSDTNLILNTNVVITFNTTSYDYDGTWDATNNCWRAPMTGLYEFDFRLLTDTAPVAGERFTALLLDFDTAAVLSVGTDIIAPTNGRVSMQGSDRLELAEGQRVSVAVNQANGTTRAIDGSTSPNNYFTGKRA